MEPFGLSVGSDHLALGSNIGADCAIISIALNVATPCESEGVGIPSLSKYLFQNDSWYISAKTVLIKDCVLDKPALYKRSNNAILFPIAGIFYIFLVVNNYSSNNVALFDNLFKAST